MELDLTSRSARSSIFVGMVRDDAALALAGGCGISRLMQLESEEDASSVVSEDASEVGSQASMALWRLVIVHKHKRVD